MLNNVLRSTFSRLCSTHGFLAIIVILFVSAVCLAIAGHYIAAGITAYGSAILFLLLLNYGMGAINKAYDEAYEADHRHGRTTD